MGRIMQRAKTLPQSEVIRQLNPKIRVGALLPHLREPSRLQPARSTHVGKAPPLGTPTTPNQIRRMGPETVLASV